MENLYYVVKKETEHFDDFEATTGWKNITVYQIDTQAMHLVEMCSIDSKNTSNSEKEIQEWLDNQEIEEEYSFVEL